MQYILFSCIDEIINAEGKYYNTINDYDGQEFIVNILFPFYFRRLRAEKDGGYLKQNTAGKQHKCRAKEKYIIQLE